MYVRGDENIQMAAPAYNDNCPSVISMGTAAILARYGFQGGVMRMAGSSAALVSSRCNRDLDGGETLNQSTVDGAG